MCMASTIPFKLNYVHGFNHPT